MGSASLDYILKEDLTPHLIVLVFDVVVLFELPVPEMNECKNLHFFQKVPKTSQKRPLISQKLPKVSQNSPTLVKICLKLVKISTRTALTYHSRLPKISQKLTLISQNLA